MRYCYTALLYLLTAPLFAQTITAFTAGMDKRAGFLTFYYDAKKGKIWLEIDRFGQEMLYYPSLAQGVGSNDIGLDRGRLGGEHVVRFERSGNKVLLIEPNYGYRALSRDSLERRAVAESFAQSVHAGFEVAAEEGGRVLVDLTPFLMPIPGTTQLNRLAENLGAVGVKLTADELRELEAAASNIPIQGARYPAEMEKKSGL